MSYLKACIRIDTRSLAVFRIVAGSLIVADLLLRSRNFSFFYTEEGVVPRSLAMASTPDYAFSIYYVSTDPYVIAALFVLQALIAVQLVVGYKTRVATILSFLFVVSLDHHNPFVLSYADTLFRLLLFWAIFLPLGERWSIDALQTDRQPRATFAGVASVLILSQVVVMYFVNGLHKSTSDLWTSGEATPLIMGIDEITFLIGDFTREFPTLLQYGGLAWYYVLLFSPLLVLLRGRLRLPLVAMFMAGHASFAVTVRIGQFPYVALAGLVLFVQTPFWKDARTLLEYASVDVEAIYESATGLGRLGSYFPAYAFDAAWQRQLKTAVYDVSLAVIVVSILLVGAVGTVHVGTTVGDDASAEERIETAVANNTVAGSLNAVAAIFGVDQPNWSVFAPNPRTTDRYYVFPAETADGEHLDVYNDRELTYERPHGELQKQYGTYRERFYMNSVRRGGFHGQVAPELAEHLCETWAEERDVELRRINMYYIGENVTMDTIDAPEDREIERLSLVYRHGCGDNVPDQIEPPDRQP